MKTKMICVAIAFALQLFNSSTTCFAQFTSASISDLAAGSGATGTMNTGCDIMYSSNNGDDIFVAVWESNNNHSGILFDDFAGGYTGLFLKQGIDY